MNVLLEPCVWGGAKPDLQGAGHDVWWTGDLAKDPGDEAILARAHREQRVLITLDKDFGERAIQIRLWDQHLRRVRARIDDSGCRRIRAEVLLLLVRQLNFH